MDHIENKARARVLKRNYPLEPMASCSGRCTKTCSRSTRNGSMPTATALPATTTSVDSLGSSRFSNPKPKVSGQKRTKPRKLNGKIVHCLPNQKERKLLCNHIKLTTSLRITT